MDAGGESGSASPFTCHPRGYIDQAFGLEWMPTRPQLARGPFYTLEQGMETMTPRPNQVCHLFLCGSQAKNFFYIFKWLKKIEEEYVMTLKLYEIQISVFTHLFYGHTATPIHVLSIAACTLQRPGWVVTDHMAHRADAVYYLICYMKTFPPPALDIGVARRRLGRNNGPKSKYQVDVLQGTLSNRCS